MTGRRLILTWAAVGLLAGATAAPVAAEPLTIVYQDRPPYYVTSANGVVSGLVSGPVSDAFSGADIATVWKRRPGKRQIETVRHNREAVCSPGWFKKPEREKFAKFSDVIYQDRPQVVVIRSTDLGDFKHPTLAALFGDRRQSFGVKLGYSYGSVIDDLIVRLKPDVKTTPQNVQGMVRMLIGRRFDYLLAAQEEFASLQANLPTVSDSISAVAMQDIPPGNKRYLMCSKKVPDDVLRRFNAALAKLRS